MKTAVIFYSYEGNTKFTARAIAKSLKADLIELKPINEMQSRGFMKYVWGGKSAIMKESPTLTNYSFDASKYELIILGTPIWANTITPPLRSFLKEQNLSSLKCALFCCHAGGGIRKAPQEVEKILGQKLIGIFDLINPFAKKDTDAVRNAENWAVSLTQQQ